MAGDREESKLPITTVVGLAVALATLWFVRDPLKTSRPDGEGHLQAGAGLVQARLWEDPIDAVEAVQSSPTSAGKLPASTQTPFHFEHEPPGTALGVLMIITEGSPYAESHEKRLRDRYALVSALSVACFRPEDEEHIGYVVLESEKHAIPFEWYRARKTKLCHDSSDQHRHYDKVLLVWLTDDMLGLKPVDKLNEMARFIAAQYWNVVCRRWHSWDCLSQLELKLIGPPSSSMLRTMLENARDPAVPAQWPSFGGDDQRRPFTIQLYSPWATAAPQILLQGLDPQDPNPGCADEQSCDKSLKQVLSGAGIMLEHAVPTDQTVVSALVKELERRKVLVGKDPIALIGEWDSFYGRALRIVFSAAACVASAQHEREHDMRMISARGKAAHEKDSEPKGIREECRTIPQAIRAQMTRSIEFDQADLKLSRYSFMRGLDGLLPEARDGNSDKGSKERSGSRDDSTKSDLKKLENRNISELERPEGQSQLDYLRRLVEKMKKDADPDRLGQPLKAVGILGSDIYDTLLILKAVREEFPSAVFFVTDLDARLFQESEYKWTRNLVIASPFGLQLHDDIQGDIPPFRDSYQTSGFFATLRALGHIRPSAASVKATVACEETGARTELPYDRYDIDVTKKGFSAQICPRLFEIGHYGPVDLSADKGTVMRRLGDLQPIQPARQLLPAGMKPWWPSGQGQERLGFPGTVLSLGLAGLLIVLLFTRLAGRTWNLVSLNVAGKEAGRCMAIISMAALCVVGIAYGLLLSGTLWLKNFVIGDGWEGEPLSIVDGVSTWPTIVVRALVVAWCLGCILRAWHDLGRSSGPAEEFALESRRAPRSIGQVLSGFITSIGWMYGMPRNSDQCHYAESVWAEYRSAGSMDYRLGRSLILWGGYMAFVWIMMAAFTSGVPAARPCRGLNNCAMDLAVMKAAVYSMIFLNMFIFDAVMLCQSFIARLKAIPIQWPKAALSKFERTRGMNSQYLPDYLMVRLVAARTHTVHKLVFCPFIALFLMVLSRNRFFDNWDFPIWLILIWALYAVIAIWSLLLLRWTASEARDSALTRYREQLIALVGTKQRGKFDAEQIRMTIQELEGIREGAYAPLVRHPAFSASLLAVIAFLQYWLIGQ
jgi:hypothetical protein